MVATSREEWDNLQTSFLAQVSKLAELAIGDAALEKRIAQARTERQARRDARSVFSHTPVPPPALVLGYSTLMCKWVGVDEWGVRCGGAEWARRRSGVKARRGVCRRESCAGGSEL